MPHCLHHQYSVDVSMFIIKSWTSLYLVHQFPAFLDHFLVDHGRLVGLQRLLVGLEGVLHQPDQPRAPPRVPGHASVAYRGSAPGLLVRQRMLILDTYFTPSSGGLCCTFSAVYCDRPYPVGPLTTELLADEGIGSAGCDGCQANELTFKMLSRLLYTTEDHPFLKQFIFGSISA